MDLKEFRCACEIINGRTFVPLRFVAENSGEKLNGMQIQEMFILLTHLTNTA